MAKVNRTALANALEKLHAEGVITGWQPRPFGMYMVGLLGGEVLRPDTKETAMWVQGAMYARAVSGLGDPPESASDVSNAESMLEQLRETNLIDGWRRDLDGDFELDGRDGESVPIEGRNITLFVAAAAWTLHQSSITPADQKAALATALDVLRSAGHISAWFIDDRDQYRIWIPTAEEPVHLPDGRATTCWLQGFSARGIG